jgi:hypothetical protein
MAAGMQGPAIAKVAGDQWGNLVDRLAYDRKPPERKNLKVDEDVECCGKYDIR